MADRSQVRFDSQGSPDRAMTDRIVDYGERVAKTSLDLRERHDDVDRGRNDRFTQMQVQIETMEERLSASEDAGAKKFLLLKDKTNRFQRELDEARKARECLEVKSEEIGQVSKSLHAALDAEQQALRAAEAKLLRIFEEKTIAVHRDIETSANMKFDNDANLRQYVDFDVPKLCSSLKKETEEREAMEQRMLKQAMGEVKELQGMVLEEKTRREESEEAMLRMMEDVVTKMQHEIAEERRQRRRTEEMLRNVLDATCHKLEVVSKSL